MKETNFTVELLKNHKKLLRISNFADIGFWIAIGIIPLLLINFYLQFFGQFGIDKEILLAFIKSPEFFFQVLPKFFNLLIKILVWVLVLKSVSLGLRMLVITDINYRIKGEKTNG